MGSNQVIGVGVKATAAKSEFTLLSPAQVRAKHPLSPNALTTIITADKNNKSNKNKNIINCHNSTSQNTRHDSTEEKEENQELDRTQRLQIHAHLQSTIGAQQVLDFKLTLPRAKQRTNKPSALAARACANARPAAVSKKEGGEGEEGQTQIEGAIARLLKGKKMLEREGKGQRDMRTYHRDVVAITFGIVRGTEVGRFLGGGSGDSVGLGGVGEGEGEEEGDELDEFLCLF